MAAFACVMLVLSGGSVTASFHMMDLDVPAGVHCRLPHGGNSASIPESGASKFPGCCGSLAARCHAASLIEGKFSSSPGWCCRSSFGCEHPQATA